MAILITGGAGYIGSHTMVEFLEAGRELVVVDNFLNSKPEALERVRRITGKDFKFYEVDLLDYDALDKVFEENDIDSCIHFGQGLGVLLIDEKGGAILGSATVDRSGFPYAGVRQTNDTGDDFGCVVCCRHS